MVEGVILQACTVAIVHAFCDHNEYEFLSQNNTPFYVCYLRAKLGHSVLKHELKALSFIFVVFCDDHLYFVMMARVRVWIKVRSVSKSMKTSSLMLGSWEQK